MNSNQQINDEIDITPGIEVLQSFQNYDYTPWEAFAEYVDNALQSFIACKRAKVPFTNEQEKVTVNIFMTPDTYMIEDDAGGIPSSRWADAFKSGKRPPNNPSNSLSEFGMGMKTASCWFARKWTVKTKAYEDVDIKSLELDMNNLVPILNTIRTKAENPNDHYTIITLTELNQGYGPTTITKIRDHLADTFRTFLRDGILEISVSTLAQIKRGKFDILKAPEIKCLESPVWLDNPPRAMDDINIKWERDIEFTLEGKARNGDYKEVPVKGRIWILDTGDTSSAGLTLFRRGRAIQGDIDDPYKPYIIFGKSNSFRYQRLGGEIHLPDEMPVTHTKTKIVFPSVLDFDEAEEKDANDGNISNDNHNSDEGAPELTSLEDQFHIKLLQAFREEPSYIKQADWFRKRESTKSTITDLKQIMKTFVSELSKHPEIVKKIDTEKMIDLIKENYSAPPVETRVEKLLATAEDTIQLGESIYKVSLREHPNQDLPFIAVERKFIDEKTTSVLLSINTDHSFYRTFAAMDNGRQGLISLAYAIGFAYLKTEEAFGGDMYEAKTFLSLINNYLKDIFSQLPRVVINERLV